MVILTDELELRKAVTRREREREEEGKRINEAGQLILKICKERNMFWANTMFDHKQMKRYIEWQVLASE